MDIESANDTAGMKTTSRPVDNTIPARSAQPTRALVVLNPVAGATAPLQVRRTIGAAFETAGARCDFYETTGSDRFRDLIGRAQEVGYNLIVAAGGDGTIADVADALVGTDLPLGIVPLGTGNILSMELGIPQNVPEAASLLVGDHETCQLDAIRVDGRHFFLQVGVGLDSLMIRGTSRQAKRALGRLAYLITLVRELIGYHGQRMRLLVDGKVRRVRAWEAIVANAGTAGSPLFHWSPDICPTDGTLDLVVVNLRDLLDFVRLGWRLALGLPESGPPVSLYRVREEATIATQRPLPVQADGEIIGDTPVTMHVVPKAITVVVPCECPVKTCAVLRTEAERRERAHQIQNTLARCLGPVGAIDTSAALFIASIPRPPVVNFLMTALATAMNRGDALVLFVLLESIKRHTARSLFGVVPALWLTDLTVESFIKRVFARDRPFQAEVLAPVAGRKPGSHSFPSGHTAAAFAGAWLISRFFPGLSVPLYGLASLVGFCRLYLGVHYLSDVVAGAVSGVALAALFRSLVGSLFRR